MADGLPEVRSALVTTDLSELGDRAIPWAYAILPRGSVVHLLHVIEPVTQPNPLYAHYTPGRAPTAAECEAQRRAIEDALAERIPPGATARGIETRLAVVEDHAVAEAIIRTAAEREVDLVCIASHGRSGLSKTLFGSVAERVMAESDLPVLVVRAGRA